MMEKVEFTKETKPKDIFIYTCQRISEPFIPLGYNYLKSKNAIIKKEDEFTFGIYFQPSIRCGSTTFLVHVAIHSKKLGEWRKIKYDINTNNDVVLSTSLARLTTRKDDWPHYLVSSFGERERVIAEIIEQINHYALPYFARFQNINSFVNEVKAEGFLPHNKKQHIILRKEWLSDFIACFDSN